MCGYCKNKEKNAYIVCTDECDDGVDARIIRENGAAFLAVSGWYDGWDGGAVYIEQQTAPIRFCPMCGRELGAKVVDA